MMTDPVADLCTRIRNAQQARHERITVPASRLKRAIIDVLLDEGYLAAVEEVTGETGHPELAVTLKYHRGQGVIDKISRCSKPSRRNYAQAKSIPRVLDGLGIAVVSTSKGLMTDAKARSEGLGGEVMLFVS